jgi:hypothetical protein
VLEESQEIQCPYCGADLSHDPDPSGGLKQSYIEDCSVCCKPIRFELEWSGNELIRFCLYQMNE